MGNPDIVAWCCKFLREISAEALDKIIFWVETWLNVTIQNCMLGQMVQNK